MGHMAKIENNTVVLVLASKDEDDNRELEISEETGETYRRTSYNTRGGVYYDSNTGEPSIDQSKSFRYNYAGVGFTFDPNFGPDGAFIPPKPYSKWILNENTALWEPPIPPPEEGSWIWNDEVGDWEEIIVEE